jgi:hypothetical protein
MRSSAAVGQDVIGVPGCTFDRAAAQVATPIGLLENSLAIAWRERRPATDGGADLIDLTLAQLAQVREP